MVFSDQTYSVLVVSAAQKFNEAFAAMLPGSEYYPVRFVGNIAAARREMVNKTYDPCHHQRPPARRLRHPLRHRRLQPVRHRGAAAGKVGCLR